MWLGTAGIEPGVRQFHLLHIMLSRWHLEMRRELPQVVDDLIAAGAHRFNMLLSLPESWRGPARPGDDRFDLVTARRPMLEAVLARSADGHPNITVERGVAVTGLIAAERPSAIPHVAGVLSPEPFPERSDLVVDATGRRSAMPAMVEAIGAPRPSSRPGTTPVSPTPSRHFQRRHQLRRHRQPTSPTTRTAASDRRSPPPCSPHYDGVSRSPCLATTAPGVWVSRVLRRQGDQGPLRADTCNGSWTCSRSGTVVPWQSRGPVQAFPG